MAEEHAIRIAEAIPVADDLATRADLHKAHIEQMAAIRGLRDRVTTRVGGPNTGVAGIAEEVRGIKWILVGILVAVASAAIKYLFFPAG